MGASVWGKAVYFPSSPLRYIREQAAPGTTITYDPGTDNAAAAKAAASAQLAIVFVTQWMSEGQDSATLSLPDHQDALVAAVAAANPNTIVVLENGGPVNMPWAPSVKGHPRILVPRHRRRPGHRQYPLRPRQPLRQAARHLRRHGRRPTPSPRHRPDRHAPATTAPTPAAPATRPATSPSTTTSKAWPSAIAGSRRKIKQPQFPFGFGLSYTHFAYSNLKVDPAAKSVTFDLRNTGAVAGDEIAEVYVTLPTSAGEPFRKLAGWKRVSPRRRRHTDRRNPARPALPLHLLHRRQRMDPPCRRLPASRSVAPPRTFRSTNPCTSPRRS